MSRYASGHSIGSAATLDKERIMQALNGKLVVGEDGHGFIYEEAPWHECKDFILDTFDNQVYQCKELATAGRVFERILEDMGIKLDCYFEDFIRYHMEESEKFQDDYVYEHEVRDFIEGLEDGTQA